MKATARHRAHRKRRRDSGIVGQATTNEPIDTRVRACYAYSTLVLVGSGGGTTSVRLLRLSRCRVCFLRSLRALCNGPSPPPWDQGPEPAVEAVNLRIHRSHSTAAATNKKYARYGGIQRRRHRLGQTSCAYRSPPELRLFRPPSTPKTGTPASAT